MIYGSARLVRILAFDGKTGFVAVVQYPRVGDINWFHNALCFENLARVARNQGAAPV